MTFIKIPCKFRSNLNEMLEWANDCLGYYEFLWDLELDCAKFWFSKEQDATLFLLRWA